MTGRVADEGGPLEGEATARRIVAECESVLERPLVSAILHGSLTLDDFRPGASDVDLLLVVDRGLSEAEAEALVSVVRRADPRPAGGIDLLVVTAAAAAVPTPSLELLAGRYGVAADVEIERRVEVGPDLWAELSEARAHGRALSGGHPQEVIAHVPGAEVRARGHHWLTTWLGRADDEANAVLMVLTACRIWRFAVDGEHCAKSEAGRWVLARDPSLSAVHEALAQRAGGRTSPIDAADVTHTLRAALRAVDEASLS